MTQADRHTEEFIRLVTHYQPRIYLFIYSLLPSHLDAEEVLQETNLVLWRKFGEFRHGSDFRAWAFEVAFRNVQAHVGRRGRDRLRFKQKFLDTVASMASGQPDDLDARQQALTDCLAGLSEKDRKLIQSRYQPQASVASVAVEVSRSVDAIYKAMARIRRALHDCIRRKLAAEER